MVGGVSGPRKGAAHPRSSDGVAEWPKATWFAARWQRALARVLAGSNPAPVSGPFYLSLVGTPYFKGFLPLRSGSTPES
jgi:hypothetical protein